MSVKFVGVLTGAVMRSGRVRRLPPALLGVDSERGLVSARTPEDLWEGRYLTPERTRENRVREVRYYRDRSELGYPVPDWFHETTAAYADTSGAVHSPTATVCDLDGEFICGG